MCGTLPLFLMLSRLDSNGEKLYFIFKPCITNGSNTN